MSAKGLEVPAVIPALRQSEDWPLLGVAPRGAWVFLLGGTMDGIAEAAGRLQKRGWTVFVHFDMVRAVSSDVEGLRFFSGYVGPQGIISTHSTTINHAKKLGLWTIQRIFLLDTQSVQTGIQQVLSTKPDAVEIMPGLLVEIARRVVRDLPCPVIAGGLVGTREDVEKMRQVGVKGVSTSARPLWPLGS
ncbi:MAG: glycerol-3-phosphate responsive antiterminator [Firmicutes bacterium]|nr:glycerol-3-phosphate responsive antiterminator [Bacillota bacterium]